MPAITIPPRHVQPPWRVSRPPADHRPGARWRGRIPIVVGRDRPRHGRLGAESALPLARRPASGPGHSGGHRRLEDPGPIPPGVQEVDVLRDVSGYIRFVDTRRLVFLAKSCRVKVRLLRRVGQFIPAGIPLLMVSKGDRLSPENSADFRGAFDLGPSRTLQQDVEFGVLQIVDIATSTPDPAYRRTLADQGRRILAGCAEKLGESELAGIRA